MSLEFYFLLALLCGAAGIVLEAWIHVRRRK